MEVLNEEFNNILEYEKNIINKESLQCNIVDILLQKSSVYQLIAFNVIVIIGYILSQGFSRFLNHTNQMDLMNHMNLTNLIILSDLSFVFYIFSGFTSNNILMNVWFYIGYIVSILSYELFSRYIVNDFIASISNMNYYKMLLYCSICCIFIYIIIYHLFVLSKTGKVSGIIIIILFKMIFMGILLCVKKFFYTSTKRQTIESIPIYIIILYTAFIFNIDTQISKLIIGLLLGYFIQSFPRY